MTSLTKLVKQVRVFQFDQPGHIQYSRLYSFDLFFQFEVVSLHDVLHKFVLLLLQNHSEHVINLAGRLLLPLQHGFLPVHLKLPLATLEKLFRLFKSQLESIPLNQTIKHLPSNIHPKIKKRVKRTCESCFYVLFAIYRELHL